MFFTHFYMKLVASQHTRTNLHWHRLGKMLQRCTLNLNDGIEFY
jgi:hypothetical protein